MIKKAELFDIAEVEYSEKYLRTLFRKFQKEKLRVGLMGGWAVHFLIQKKGKEHIGSRDIDIFFNPDETNPKKLIEIVEREGFRPHSTFKWALFVDRSEKKEVSEEESKKIPLHNLFTVYVDIFSSKDTGNSYIFYEPLLAEVFREYELLELNGLKIMVPTPIQLVKLKLKSVLEREEYKQIKDMIDIFVLITEFPEVFKKIERNSELRRNFRSKLDRFVVNGIISKTGTNLGIDSEIIEDILKQV